MNIMGIYFRKRLTGGHIVMQNLIKIKLANWQARFKSNQLKMRHFFNSKCFNGDRMSRITESAYLQDCTIRLPGVCCGDPETTVWCHSNSYQDGKGRSLKAHDHCGAYGCWKCHAVFDRQVPLPAGLTWDMVEQCFSSGMRLSQEILIQLKLWDGKSLPEKPVKKFKSRKIAVTGMSALQRLCVPASESVGKL